MLSVVILYLLDLNISLLSPDLGSTYNSSSTFSTHLSSIVVPFLLKL